ncbi:MAG: hypothetical protein ABIS38_05460 [Sphingomicrobium sp.]
MRRLLALLACTLASCATPPIRNAPLAGQWGGEHVGLDLGAAGGRLEYDCAAGTIDAIARSDSSGRFTATGTHTPGTGGPVQIGVVPASFPAHYAGRVNGGIMTLTIDVPAIGARIGPYTLRRGAQPGLLRCL